MSDEHNPFYSSVYNHPFVKTPNMEKLKEIGTLFNNAYCPSPLCLPSRSSFLFGRRVHELQTYNNCHNNLKLKFYSPLKSFLPLGNKLKFTKWFICLITFSLFDFIKCCPPELPMLSSPSS